MADNDKIVLDQIFRFPDAVKDVEYKTGDESEVWEILESEDVESLYADTEDDTDGFDEDDGEPDAGDGDSGSVDTLYPPDWMEVVSQSVKTLPGGGQVVDVIIELPDLESDEIKYDVRVTK